MKATRGKPALATGISHQSILSPSAIRGAPPLLLPLLLTISASPGSSIEYTPFSLILRAISCVYCEP